MSFWEWIGIIFVIGCMLAVIAENIVAGMIEAEQEKTKQSVIALNIEREKTAQAKLETEKREAL